MNQCVLGIDLGTSSVKIVKKYRNGHIEKYRSDYKEPLPLGWWNAILRLLEDIKWDEVIAIGLSSQVGTYLVNDKEIIPWNSDVGKEELKWWKLHISQEKFLEEISMPHPEIISYPLPRLKYIVEHFKEVKKICQPKEYILEKLTGNRVSDIYSWRGLVNLKKENYSEFFLEQLSLKKEMLPPIKKMDEIAGYTKRYQFKNNILPEGIPVYTGLNDFYAGLLGMGVNTVGQVFDVTGTSEHLGILQRQIAKNTSLVSGPYINYKVHYGVTASSGPSIKFGLKLIQNLRDEVINKDKKNQMIDLDEIVKEKPPIFLPYLKGERAPIWNANARGMFFGIEENCSVKEMVYAVMEGVVFSVYHIYETMEKPEMNKITISGGAANIDILNRLKAEIFGVEIEVVDEEDVSALGACMVAAVGAGLYKNYQEVAEEWVLIRQKIMPQGQYKEWFQKRFEIYKTLYECVEPMYEKWREL